MRYFKRLASVLAFLAAVCSCGEKMDNNKTSDLDLQLVLSSPVVITDNNNTIVCNFQNGKGPQISDIVILRTDSGDKEYSCRISEIGKDSFTYVLPSDFTVGIYNFCVKWGSQLKGYGKLEYKKKDDDVKPAEGSTVYGQVICGDRKLPGVVVSDGVEVVATDEKGVYQMASKKKNGFVFISVPSGYELSSNGVLPQMKVPLVKSASTAERVDFTLYEAGDQTNHTMMFFGDIHLANRTNDRKQFQTFTTEIKSYLAAHQSEKIYAMTLGDMTWDLYWYSNNYCFAQYLSDVNVVKGLQIFHTIGNHDHNMKTSVNGNTAGWDAVDWDTGLEYRTSVAPSNFSFNIGKVHYIALDDIYCKNTTGGASGDRHYDEKVSDEALGWLKKDLSFVDKATPVVVTMHAPLYGQTGSASLANASALTACFNGYTSVTFVTGHSHKIWNVSKSNIREYNSGAVCAAWWWAGKYNPTLNIAQDGAPNGYRIMDVKGTSLTSRFKAIGRDDSYQFRSYDRNRINITPESCGVTKSENAANFVKELTECGAYNVSSGANEVLIDVWDRDDKWKVEVTENGKVLNVSKVSVYEPLFLIAYTGPRYAESTSTTWSPFKTGHMYSVKASSATSTLEIKVTDDEGRVYTETMKRPKEFTIAQYK